MNSQTSTDSRNHKSKAYMYLLLSVFFFVSGSLFSYFFSSWRSGKLDALFQGDALQQTYTGNRYSISYPHNWARSGPYEAPISGFSEYIRLISPSGDMQISIGLTGDNRFEYGDNIISEIHSVPVEIGGKTYTGHEEYLKLNGKDITLILMDIELNDVTFLGLGPSGHEVMRPVTVQLIYHFPRIDDLTHEQKIDSYNLERESALSIVKTLNFKTAKK